MAQDQNPAKTGKRKRRTRKELEREASEICPSVRPKVILLLL